MINSIFNPDVASRSSRSPLFTWYVRLHRALVLGGWSAAAEHVLAAGVASGDGDRVGAKAHLLAARDELTCSSVLAILDGVAS